MVPVAVVTSRLLLQPPRGQDANAIFARYASDPEVTRYLGWRRHESVEDTQAFVVDSQDEWQLNRCGPYLIWTRDGSTLLGCTGVHAQTATRALTGYVLASDAWGQGYATEALRAIIIVARGACFRELDAFCHAEHGASVRVLEKCGFVRVGVVPAQAFPNLSPPVAPAAQYRLSC